MSLLRSLSLLPLATPNKLFLSCPRPRNTALGSRRPLVFGSGVAFVAAQACLRTKIAAKTVHKNSTFQLGAVGLQSKERSFAAGCVAVADYGVHRGWLVQTQFSLV